MPDPSREISPGRKTLFYAGMLLIGIGLLSFFSTFLSAALHFGDFTDFESRGRSMAFRAFGGMFLMIVGGVMASLGRFGAAGSGLKLDPNEARHDLEPWNRMAGGMLNDALAEVEPVQRIVQKLTDDQTPAEVIRVRCRACQMLNDEDARFCKQCGAAMS